MDHPRARLAIEGNMDWAWQAPPTSIADCILCLKLYWIVLSSPFSSRYVVICTTASSTLVLSE